MRTYILGTEFEFIVKYYYTTIDDFGQKRMWLALSDGESERNFKVPAYAFQNTGWDGRTIRCRVTKVLDNGYPFLVQEKSDILPLCYKVGETYWFSVINKFIDSKSNKPFYVVLDRIQNIEHRFYTDQELKNLIAFVVQGITNDHLDLALADDKKEAQETKKKQEAEAIEKLRNPFGHEDNYHEWKSSLVYSAGNVETDSPDVEKQIQVILKCISGFQNAEGGLLYIGVSNDGGLCGIETDCQHLNDDGDPYVYTKNTDGFELKVRNAVSRSLGKASLDNIDFKFYFQKSTKRIFCIISIQKVSKPIYVDSKYIFKRFGNGFRQLFADDITDLAIAKLSDKSPQQTFTRPMPTDCIELNPNVDVELLRQEDISKSPVVKLAKDFLKKIDYYYMAFYRDNTFMYSKDSHMEDDGILTEVRFNKINGNLEYSRDILVKCTPDGHAQLLQAYDVCKLGNPDSRISFPSKYPVFDIKVAHKYDFVKVVFTKGDEEREKYIRIVSLFDASTEKDLTGNMEPKEILYKIGLKGNKMIPTGYSLKEVTIVHERLPDEIQFVSAKPGSDGKGNKVGDQIDASIY